MKNKETGSQSGFLKNKWQSFKAFAYPFLRPVIQRYRRLEARSPRLAKLVFWLGSIFAVGFGSVLLFIFAILIGVFGHVASKSDLRNLNQSVASEVYTADSVLLGKYFIENRLPTSLDSISPHIVNALIATEDARFFEHGGVDLRATFRVLFRSILAGDESSGGGSTISQQLAKNLYPRKRLGKLTTPVAKFKEMIVARRLEKVYDKNQILALYLNTVPYGENVFGIKIAAERFFSTTPHDIKVEDAATLVGMLKANTAYNPVRNPERAKERRNVVFGQMVKYGKLEQAVADSLAKLPVVTKYHIETHNDGKATYFRETLRLQLDEELKKYTHADGRPYNLYTDGLKIYTTINSKLQDHAEEAVQFQMKDLQKKFIEHFKGYGKDAVTYGSEELLQEQKKLTDRYKQLKEKGLTEEQIDSNFMTPVKMTIFSWDTETQDLDTLMSPLDSLKYYLSILNTGLLAADPHTGKVLAWVGGINFKHFKFDHVNALRQVGSTFKPVVYAKAIEAGVSPCERFPNDFVTYPEWDNWAPRNHDGKYGGSYSMMGGMRNSVNTTAVRLIMHDSVGIDSVIALAKRMGISAKIPQEPGIALGAVDATLFEMVRLFAVFANRGVQPKLTMLSRIEDKDGKPIAQFESPDPRTFARVLQDQHADMVRHLLQGVVDGGTGGRLRWLANSDFRFLHAAGKTGTTDNNSDGWFLCFTPSIVVGAWVGAEQPLVRWRSTRLGQGGATALPIVGRFLKSTYDDPAFKAWTKESFPPLTGEAAMAFGCPDKFAPPDWLTDSIAYWEKISLDSISPEIRDLNLSRLRAMKAARDSIRNVDTTATEIELPVEGETGGEGGQNDRRTSSSGTRSEESLRIERQNEKLERKRERKEKRKEFFDGLLGKGN
ncbi:MAG: transglycosylase domain-containing protein [Saprospiraceae bacterium]|nr:transglycosylase domain-containing protein [Saprospiraceae bacterium]